MPEQPTSYLAEKLINSQLANELGYLQSDPVDSRNHRDYESDKTNPTQTTKKNQKLQRNKNQEINNKSKNILTGSNRIGSQI